MQERRQLSVFGWWQAWMLLGLLSHVGVQARTQAPRSSRTLLMDATHLHGIASYQPIHQPILCPTTCWPPQQLTSFWMKSLHCVPAGKQAGGVAPACGVDGV